MQQCIFIIIEFGRIERDTIIMTCHTLQVINTVRNWSISWFFNICFCVAYTRHKLNIPIVTFISHNMWSAINSFLRMGIEKVYH